MPGLLNLMLIPAAFLFFAWLSKGFSGDK